MVPKDMVCRPSDHFFLPIGLAVMWRHASWKVTTKAVITGFFALAVLWSPDKNVESAGFEQEAADPTDQVVTEAEGGVETDSNDASDQSPLKAKQDSNHEVQKNKRRKSVLQTPKISIANCKACTQNFNPSGRQKTSSFMVLGVEEIITHGLKESAR